MRKNLILFCVVAEFAYLCSIQSWSAGEDGNQPDFSDAMPFHIIKDALAKGKKKSKQYYMEP